MFHPYFLIQNITAKFKSPAENQYSPDPTRPQTNNGTDAAKLSIIIIIGNISKYLFIII